MKYALPLMLLASPALAHHEATTLALLPTMIPAIAALCAVAVPFWARRAHRRKNRAPQSGNAKT